MSNKVITHNEYNVEQALINLPISILRECKKKDTLRAIALSLFIKAHRGDSTLRDTSIRNLMKVLHCGQKRATQCFKDLTNNKRLFIQTNSNSFIAKTFKTNIKKDRNRRNGIIYECYCYKMAIKKDWSLRDIETHLRDALLTYAINAKERREISSNYEPKKQTLSNSSDWLTFSKLANISGFSRSTARRHIYKLESKKIISVKKGSTNVVCASSSDEALACYGINANSIVITKNGVAIIFTPNEYHIANRKVTDSFRNIIYNHSHRYTMNCNADNVDFFDMIEQGKHC